MIDGIDEHRVSAWLCQHLPEALPPLRYDLIPGGRSNLTFRVSDAAGKAFVLRRPPLGRLLPTAHDVVREHRIIAALRNTSVPVPEALAVCDDPSVNGAPFFVTRFVDGVVLDSVEKLGAIDVATRRDLSFHLIDVLAELHSVDIEAVGLADLSRQEGYLDRQIRRWTKQWADSRTRDLPIIDRLGERLLRVKPEQRGTALVHGDYRFGNVISDPGRRVIAAVLDWELCTLGDPLADLGHMAVYWSDPLRALPLTNDPTVAGGFPAFAELAERYVRRTGRDVRHLDYYRAFAAWRLAVIAEGVASRHQQRHPDDVPALEASRRAVEGLAAFAMESFPATVE